MRACEKRPVSIETLEKLIEPFKVGDIVRTKNLHTSISNIIITKVNSSGYEGIIGDTSNKAYFSFKHQDDYELTPVVPKFKVGDRIRLKHNSNGTDVIIDIADNMYVLSYADQIYLNFKYQDNYELVSNKFDINTLKPFDKVLVRQCDIECWKPALWGRRATSKDFPFITSFGATLQAIPFKGNEYLLGTTDDCDEYYKTWKN